MSALRTTTGVRRIPVMMVVSNLARATGDMPVLLSLKDLETILHELGHAMHTIFGATDLFSFSQEQAQHGIFLKPHRNFLKNGDLKKRY